MGTTFKDDPQIKKLFACTELADKYGYWGEHPDFPVADWQYEVANNDTRASYWEWVAAGLGKIEL